MNKKFLIFIFISFCCICSAKESKPRYLIPIKGHEEITKGISMLPTYSNPDRIFVGDISYDEIQEEDVVMRKYMRTRVVHRVKFYVKGRGWKTAGDNNIDKNGNIIYDRGWLTPENFEGLILPNRPNKNLLTKNKR